MPTFEEKFKPVNGKEIQVGDVIITKHGAWKKLPEAGDAYMPDIFKLTLVSTVIPPQITVTNQKGTMRSVIPYDKKFSELFPKGVSEVYVIGTPMLSGLQVERVIVGPEW